MAMSAVARLHLIFFDRLIDAFSTLPTGIAFVADGFAGFQRFVTGTALVFERARVAFMIDAAVVLPFLA